MNGFMHLRHTGWTTLGAGLLAGLVMGTTQGCDPESVPGGDVCGPCGSIASGQLSISGNSRIDGFFTAVADFQAATGAIRGQFEADVLALAEVYGVAGAQVNAQLIADLKAAIQADINLYASGGVKLEYSPPRCSANVSVAVEAQASCEAQAECDVQVDPGMVAVECEGKCSGGCSAECMGEIACKTPEAGITCDGTCEGSCELSGAATCDGTCRGMCTGNCSLTNAEGECEGRCDAMCMGTCELAVAAQCDGQCHGTCVAEADPGGCEGEVECRGTCMGECSGSCEGNFKPPSASADCEASAECEAQASAQAEANVECTPPSLEFAFELNAGGDASLEAGFLARIEQLKIRGIAIIQGFARAQALFTGEVNGEVVFNPSPVAKLTGEIQGLIDAGVEGEFDIAIGRLPCVIPAFVEAGEVLASAGTEFTGTLQAQADFAAFLTVGIAGG